MRDHHRSVWALWVQHMYGEILTLCIVAGLVGVVVGMLILSAFSAIILWAATAMAGRIDEEQDID